MADSLQMIGEMVAYLDTLPKAANGDVKVEDPSAVAVAFIGIAAPLYGAEFDAQLQRAETAELLAGARQAELIGLRADVDNYRSVVAAASGALASGDPATAAAVLATL